MGSHVAARAQNAVVGSKVKNHSLTGADINSSGLATVPSAGEAALAALATSALKADTAAHATTADSAGVAYSTHFEKVLTLPGSPPGGASAPTVIASLHLPAGSYVLVAKGQVETSANAVVVSCDVIAETDKDSSFVQGGDGHQTMILANSLVHTFAAPGTVNLNCTALQGAAAISQVRLTAMTFGSIVSSGPGPGG